MEEGKKPLPPDFLGVDTSHEQLKKVPIFYLGLPAKPAYICYKPRTTSFRSKDLSGTLFFYHKVHR